METNTQIKFTDEEMNTLRDIQKSYNDATLAFGSVYLQKKQLDELETGLNKEFQELKNREKSFMDSVVNKYGEGSVDPATGVFTPAPKKAE
jgi:hypothetical protein